MSRKCNRRLRRRREKNRNKRKNRRRQLTRTELRPANPQQNTRIYQKWTDSAMLQAVKKVKEGKLSLKKASKVHQIPKRTLRRYLEQNQFQVKKMGRPFTLTDQQCNDLCERVKHLAAIGYPITTKILRLCVYKFCTQNELKHRFSDIKQIAGYKWLRQFLTYNSDISVRQPQTLNPARAQKLNKVVVNNHFSRYKNVVQENELQNQPLHQHNMDEKSCRLTKHKNSKVLAATGARRVHTIGSEHGENVTIVGCVNAAGGSIPPMILFKGKNKKREYCDDLPSGTLVEMTEKGSMNTKSFVKFMKHFAEYKPRGTNILVFDGAKCHLDYEIVEEAEKHDIILYCLPSNTTHELQPLDKAVFRSFEHHWEEELTNYWFNNPDRTLNKQKFGRIFTPAWDKSVTPANIKSGFRATGLYPFNPNVIPEEAFMPSQVSFLPDPNSSTPSPATNATCQSEPSTSNNERVGVRVHIPPSEKIDSMEEACLASDSDISDTEQDPSGENQNHRNVFSEILPSPKRTRPKVTNRKQSLNAHAVVLTREMFRKPQEKPKNKIENPKKRKLEEIPSTSQASNGTKKKCTKKLRKTQNLCRDEEWFCKICLEDWVKDMRMCIKCQAFVHEDCVGFDEQDSRDLICPKCEE